MEIIQEIGSYAGLAAIVGLAVLSALYFSQARDVRRLRDWAGRAPERTTEPAAQPTRVVARPVPKPPGSQPTQPGLRPLPGAAPAASTAGAAPAVATGPAAATPAAARAAGVSQDEDSEEGVSQDTMAHPPPATRDEGVSEVEDVESDEEPQEDADHGLSEDFPAVDEDLEADDEDEEEDLGPADPEDHWDDDDDIDGGHRPPSQPPETDDRPAVAPPVPARPVPPPPRTASLPPRTLPPRAAPATPAGARPAAVAASGSTILPPYERSRPDGDPWHRRLFYSPRRAAVVIGLGVLVLAAATLGGLKLAGGEDDPSTPTAGQSQSGQASGGAQGASGTGGATDPRPTIDPSEVTVAVLNGTTVTGLAADVGDMVESEGFQLGNVTNSLDQERAESVVFYAPGAEAEAEDVGRRLKIDQREEIDPDTQALAGDASVVVVVGADKT